MSSKREMCPYIKENIGCQNRECRHNVLWVGLKLPNPAGTPETLSFLNCMILLNREFTLQEISDAWGMTRERIRQIELVALMKIGRRAKRKMKDFIPFGGVKRFNKKYNRYIETGKKKVT